MDDTLVFFLERVRDDIFKLLPMKEEELDGSVNYLNDYIDALVVTMKGALKNYPDLHKQKSYLYAINSLYYIRKREYLSFPKWRRIILDTVKEIDVLAKQYEGG